MRVDVDRQLSPRGSYAGPVRYHLETARRRVLFVEDEPAIRSTYVRCFATTYEMAFAGSGSEALSQLQTFNPDVLVLDMRLPDTDGVALLQKIRVTHPDLPVVVTTARPRP